MKMTRNKCFFFIALSLPFLVWYCSQNKNTSLHYLDREGAVHTLSLPVKDKKRLFCFMRLLFAEDNFAYTLLGSKPVSWACYEKPLPFVNLSTFHGSLKEYSRTLRIGWKTWSKYRHLFPSTLFWAEGLKSSSGWVSILIVNEEQFDQVVRNHKQDFQDVLQREIMDGFQLLQEAKDHSLIKKVLKGHQALIGIVLGYGRDNSWEFMKRAEKREFFKWVWDEKDEEIPGKIYTKLGGRNIEECLERESCPSFAGYPHSEESMALKKEYLLTQQKIIHYYKDKDFLEATLSLLAGFRPPELSN